MVFTDAKSSRCLMQNHGDLSKYTFWNKNTTTDHGYVPPVFSGVRVMRSLVLCVMFVDRCLTFSPFSFDHCIVLLRYFGF